MPTDPLTILAASASAGGDETEALAVGLRRLWASVVQGLRHGDSVGGLHIQQFWVLVLTRNDPIRMSEIARALETSQANVTGLVDRLERAGYVERVRAESDRRVVQVGITVKGAETLAQLRTQYRQRVDHMLRHLDVEERKQLLALIMKALDGD
jgi:DNA-binding MarR family transcriptional regulator